MLRFFITTVVLTLLTAGCVTADRNPSDPNSVTVWNDFGFGPTLGFGPSEASLRAATDWCDQYGKKPVYSHEYSGTLLTTHVVYDCVD